MSVLSLLTEQFPELYKALEGDEQQIQDAEPGLDAPEAAAAANIVPEPSAEAVGDATQSGQQDPYLQKIESITGRVSCCSCME